MHHRLMKKGNNSLILSFRISGVTLVLVSDIFPIFVSIGLGKNNFENTLEGHTKLTPQSGAHLEMTPYSCPVRGFTLTFLQASLLENYLSCKNFFFGGGAHWALEYRYITLQTKEIISELNGS